MEIIHKNYKSDFDAILHLKSCVGDVCKEIGWPGYDWVAKFYTTSHDNVYIASNVGGVLTNCFNDNGNIHVVFNNHGLLSGTLRVEFSAEIPNGIYPDGSQLEVSPQPLDIELVRGVGDCGTIADVEVMLSFIKGDKGDAFTYEDFTAEQIAELQRPATEAAESVSKLEEEVSQAEVLMQALRREFDRHKEVADDEFEKIENNRQALVAEDERQQAEIDAQQAQITAAAGQLETVRKLLHSGASWANIKGAFDGLGSNYNSLWALASTVKTFLEAADTSDATINRWQELEVFLQGVTDTDSLLALLEEQKNEIGKEYVAYVNEQGEQLTEAIEAAHMKDIRALAKAISVKSVTWAEIKQLRDAGHLDDGTQYRITDYETTVANDPEARSAGHPFDLVVMALDAGTLSERAWAMRSARDTAGYFAGAKLESWQVWYCLDNDTTRFQWADTATGKGVIYRLIDEWGNDCPYDFKNVQFKRYWANGFNTTIQNEGALPNIILKGYYGTTSNTDIFTEGIDTNDSLFCFTFTRLNNIVEDYEKDSVTQSNVLDESIQTEGFDIDAGDDLLNNRCRNNILKPTETGLLVDTKKYMALVLLNNVFITVKAVDDYEAYRPPFDNTLGVSCVNNTFGNYCYGNSFGNNCNNNSFGNMCINNSFGNYCALNFFGNMCNSNSFGNMCINNSFGNYCALNFFGNYCSSNFFGNDCNGNFFGNDCNGNSFGNGCDGNTFGNSCTYNTFGDGCQNNTFGPNCYYNAFGDGCYNNTFGNGCVGNTFGNYLQYITAGEGVKYLNVTGGSDVRHFVQNAHILNGTSGKDYDLLTVGLPEMSTVCRYVGQNTAGVLKIWVPADLV